MIVKLNAMFAKYSIIMNFPRPLRLLCLTIACLLNTCTLSIAQTDHNIGNWNSLIIKGKITPRLSLMGESNIRSSTYDLKYDYFEIKGGISCSLTTKLTGLFGTGFYNFYQKGGLFESPAVQKEFRTWLELSLKQTYHRFNFDHRIRIEQRFIPGNYKNRFRYRLALVIPVNKPQLVAGSIFLAVNDELWIPQYGPLIEKNRLYAGAGYRIKGNTSLQIGIVNDNDYKIDDHHSVTKYLQMMIIYDFTKLLKKHS